MGNVDLRYIVSKFQMRDAKGRYSCVSYSVITQDIREPTKFPSMTGCSNLEIALSDERIPEEVRNELRKKGEKLKTGQKAEVHYHLYSP